MGEILDLEPIKARLAATTPREWRWSDEVGDIPYNQAYWENGEPIMPGNDGSLGVSGLYIEVPEDEETSTLEPILEANDDIPDDPTDPGEADWSIWRGLIRVTNVADLEFIAHAKSDIAALMAEVERLRGLYSAS